MAVAAIIGADANKVSLDCLLLETDNKSGSPQTSQLTRDRLQFACRICMSDLHTLGQYS